MITMITINPKINTYTPAFQANRFLSEEKQARLKPTLNTNIAGGSLIDNSGRYIVEGKAEDVTLANMLIRCYTSKHKKLSGVKNHAFFNFIPISRLNINTCSTIHCSNENAEILHKYIFTDRNDFLFNKTRQSLDVMADTLYEKHKNHIGSDEFLTDYSKTVKKVKADAKKNYENIESLFADGKPTKILKAKDVINAILENRFDFKNGNINKKKNNLIALTSHSSIKKGFARFLHDNAELVNPDSYLDYFIDDKGILKKYKIIFRKIIKWLKTH